jgi:regulator of protease activity HflC (stomatin/prohibitin superfamily)
MQTAKVLAASSKETAEAAAGIRANGLKEMATIQSSAQKEAAKIMAQAAVIVMTKLLSLKQSCNGGCLEVGPHTSPQGNLWTLH